MFVSGNPRYRESSVGILMLDGYEFPMLPRSVGDDTLEAAKRGGRMKATFEGMTALVIYFEVIHSETWVGVFEG